MHYFLIENLPCELIRLFEDYATILRISIVAEVRTLIDEATAARIHHYPKGIAMLLKAIADRQIPKLRRVAIPADGVASRPIAKWHRADIQRHPDTVAGVE